MTTYLGLISLIFTIFLLFWINSSAPFTLTKGLGYASLLSGALGNGIDRWRLGYVTDFIQLQPIHFPVFNIADVAINIALICLIFSLIS